jgi:hypothetical protein
MLLNNSVTIDDGDCAPSWRLASTAAEAQAMDADRFDTLARSLITARSRRGASAAVLGGALGLLSWHLGEDAQAHNALLACKKKSGKAKKACLKKAKAHNAQHVAETPLPPPPVCSPACGLCQQCVNGTCDTAPNFTPCGRCKDCFAGACEPVPDGRRCGTCLECKAGTCVNQACLVCEACRDNVCVPRQCSPPDECQVDCQCNPATGRCGCSPRVCEPQGPCQENCICNPRLGCMCQIQC